MFRTYSGVVVPPFRINLHYGVREYKRFGKVSRFLIENMGEKLTVTHRHFRIFDLIITFSFESTPTVSNTLGKLLKSGVKSKLPCFHVYLSIARWAYSLFAGVRPPPLYRETLYSLRSMFKWMMMRGVVL